MEFRDFLAEIGAATHLDVNDAVQAGGCTLQMDGTWEVTIEHDEQAAAVHFHAIVLPEIGSGPWRMDMLQLLLQLHKFGIATGGAFFCLDANRESVLMMRSVSLVGMDAGHAVQALEGYVNQLEAWSRRLSDSLREFRGTQPAGLAPPTAQASIFIDRRS